MFMFGIHWKMWIANTHFTMPFTKAQHDSLFFFFFPLFISQMMNLNARRRKMVNRWSKHANMQHCKLCRLYTPCNIGTNHFLNERQKEGKEIHVIFESSLFEWPTFLFQHVFRPDEKLDVLFGLEQYKCFHVLISAMRANSIEQSKCEFFLFFFLVSNRTRVNRLIHFVHFTKLSIILHCDMQKVYFAGSSHSMKINEEKLQLINMDSNWTMQCNGARNENDKIIMKVQMGFF